MICPHCGKDTEVKKEIRRRFNVEQNDNGAYEIRDDDASRYNMPKIAVSLFFKKFDDCRKVSDLLNAEWSRFQANPE